MSILSTTRINGNLYTAGKVAVSDGTNWGQVKIYSASGYYRALEGDDYRIRLDSRNTTSTADRRYLDLYSKSGQADNGKALAIGTDSGGSGSIDYVATLGSAQTFTAEKKFDNGKFLVTGEDYRYPLTSPAAHKDVKLFVVGIEGHNYKYSNTNASVYMQSGKLYSNGTEVSVSGHTHSYLPLSGGTLTGNLTIKSTTTSGNAYGASNPTLSFHNGGSDQNLSLIFTDYDAVQSSASLTLIGNQGGEYFIAPNIRTTADIHIKGSLYFD